MENRIYCQKRWKIWDLLFLDTDRETKRDFWKLLDQRQKSLFNMVEVVAMLPTRLFAFLINRNWLMARQSQARLYCGPCCSSGGENVMKPTFSLPGVEEATWFTYVEIGWVCQGPGQVQADWNGLLLPTSSVLVQSQLSDSRDIRPHTWALLYQSTAPRSLLTVSTVVYDAIIPHPLILSFSSISSF